MIDIEKFNETKKVKYLKDILLQCDDDYDIVIIKPEYEGAFSGNTLTIDKLFISHSGKRVHITLKYERNEMV